MFRQYSSLKTEHPDAILLFRMGDFYEMFHEDARVASRLLELTLTARGKGTDNVVPMCGFPHHQLDPYVVRLVRRGEKVAICEQVEDPKKAKGLVRREVVRVVTPGTVNDPSHVEAKANVWLASVASADGALGAALLDASAGIARTCSRRVVGSIRNGRLAAPTCRSASRYEAQRRRLRARPSAVSLDATGRNSP